MDRLSWPLQSTNEITFSLVDSSSIFIFSANESVGKGVTSVVRPGNLVGLGCSSPKTLAGDSFSVSLTGANRGSANKLGASFGAVAAVAEIADDFAAGLDVSRSPKIPSSLSLRLFCAGARLDCFFVGSAAVFGEAESVFLAGVAFLVVGAGKSKSPKMSPPAVAAGAFFSSDGVAALRAGVAFFVGVALAEPPAAGVDLVGKSAKISSVGAALRVENMRVESVTRHQ